MTGTIAGMVARSLERQPPAPAVLAGEGWRTWEAHAHRVWCLVDALSGLGARAGDRVVIWTENVTEHLEIEQAVFLAGLARVSLSPWLRSEQIDFVLSDCEPAVMFTDARRAEQLGKATATSASRRPRLVVLGPDYEELLAQGGTGWAGPEPEPSALAALLYTSGSTGRPKAATVTQAAWAAMAVGLLCELPSVGEGDVILHAAPLAHLSGSVGSAASVRGVATVLHRTFDSASCLSAIAEHGVSVIPCVPTMLRALTEEAETGRYDLTGLRALVYGGARAGTELLRRAEDVFGEVLVQVYGLSEALIPLSVLRPADHIARRRWDREVRLGSVGRPVGETLVRIVPTDSGSTGSPIGEIEVAGPTVTDGYWRRPELTADRLRDGWFRTGDLGYRAESGHLYVIGRSDDVIISGGVNIYPSPIESVICAIPGVSEAVVLSVPDDHWGERLVALVQPDVRARITPEVVLAVCRQALTGPEVPKTVVIVSALPRNAHGKISRPGAREMFAPDLTRVAGGGPEA